MRTVLDAEALNALLDPRHPAERQVRASLEAAQRLRGGAWVASVTLAELYRGSSRTQALDGLLTRMLGISLRLRDTDQRFARLVGSLLHEAGAGSALLADAHAVAVAVEDGGGTVVTGDPADLTRLAAAYGNVVVAPLR